MFNVCQFLSTLKLHIYLTQASSCRSANERSKGGSQLMPLKRKKSPEGGGLFVAKFLFQTKSQHTSFLCVQSFPNPNQLLIIYGSLLAWGTKSLHVCLFHGQFQRQRLCLYMLRLTWFTTHMKQHKQSFLRVRILPWNSHLTEGLSTWSPHLGMRNIYAGKRMPNVPQGNCEGRFGQCFEWVKYVRFFQNKIT